MVARIITIIAAVTATGFFTLAALWFIGFLKIRQAWAWLFEDWDRRFYFFLTVQPGLAVLVMGLNISTIIEIYVLYLPG